MSVSNEDLADELAASEAIFDSLFEMLSDGLGCKLRVVPSPGLAPGHLESHSAQLDLEARFPPSYPKRPARIQLTNVVNVEEHRVAELAAELDKLSRSCAHKEEVSLFHLYAHASAWLQDVDPTKAQVRSAVRLRPRNCSSPGHAAQLPDETRHSPSRPAGDALRYHAAASGACHAARRRGAGVHL